MTNKQSKKTNSGHGGKQLKNGYDLKTARKIGDSLNVNFDVVDIEDFAYALGVESEHNDITTNDPIMTAKIALAHFEEGVDYYKRLYKMEIQMDEFWKNRIKPYIYLDEDNEDNEDTDIGTTTDEDFSESD